MLQVTNLSFDYADNPLLRNIDFSVPVGKLLHVRGENGSGKTTLLKLLAGIFIPIEGTISFQEWFIDQHKSDYQKQLCYLGHKLGINYALTLRENCFFALRHVTHPVDLKPLIDSLFLTGLEDVPCARLSAGQCRRVAMLRLFTSNAKLWLLDEPLVALDEQTMLVFMKFALSHLERGGIIVMTSHQALPFVAGDYLEYYL